MACDTRFAYAALLASGSGSHLCASHACRRHTPWRPAGCCCYCFMRPATCAGHRHAPSCALAQLCMMLLAAAVAKVLETCVLACPAPLCILPAQAQGRLLGPPADQRRQAHACRGPTSSSCPCSSSNPHPPLSLAAIVFPGPSRNCGRTWPELEPNLSETSSKPRISSAIAPFGPIPLSLRSQQCDMCYWPVAAWGMGQWLLGAVAPASTWTNDALQLVMESWYMHKLMALTGAPSLAGTPSCDNYNY
jgi:hypothetical protein